MTHDPHFRPREERREIAEEAESLFHITQAPPVWPAHFVLSGGLVSLVCVKAALLLAPVRAAMIGLTALALAGIVWPGWRSLRQWGVLDSAQPAHPADKPEDRHRFLGHAAFLLPIISGIGVAFVSPRLLPIEGTCQ